MTGRKRLLVTRRLPTAVERAMAAGYDTTFNAEDIAMTAAELRKAAAGHDAICTTITDTVDADVFATDGLRIVANYGAGYEHIDLDAARAAGVSVTNTPDVLTDATAELAILLMLAAARRASEGERQLRAGAWPGWHPTHLIGRSITGKTLGLIGLGRIAQATAARARGGFGMSILYTSRRRADPATEVRYDATWVASVEELVSRADVVSLHVPGGPATHHMVDAALLARMRPNTILVNTARGSVIDEDALSQALAGGGIAAAGLDVYEREPQVTPALLACENAVLLPHLGSATVETRVAMGMRALANLDAFFAGETPDDRVG